MSSSPTISIVTVVMNDVEEIEEVLQNLVGFLCEDVELVVVDGGSTDGTLEILARYQKSFAAFLSEPDDGIYDAMNKAIQLCSGRFVLHICNGDRLLSLPLRELQVLPGDVACASYPVSLSDGRHFKPSKGLKLSYRNTLHHQGTFYSRQFLEPYDLTYPTYADYDLNIRLKKTGLKIVLGTRTVAFHDQGGFSSKNGGADEFEAIVKSHGGVFWLLMAKAYSVFFVLRRRARKTLGNLGMCKHLQTAK